MQKGSKNTTTNVSLSENVVGIVTSAPSSPRLRLPKQVIEALGINEHSKSNYREAIEVLHNKDHLHLLLANENFRRACFSRHGTCELPGTPCALGTTVASSKKSYSKSTKFPTRSNIEFIEAALDQQQKERMVDDFSQSSSRRNKTSRSARVHTCKLLNDAIQTSRFQTLYNAYAAIDTSCSGRLSKRDLKRGLLRLGLRIEDGDIHKLVATFCSFVQVDALGKVTFRDFWNSFECGKVRFSRDTSSSAKRHQESDNSRNNLSHNQTGKLLPGTTCSSWSSQLRPNLPSLSARRGSLPRAAVTTTRPSASRNAKRRHSTGAALLVPHSVTATTAVYGGGDLCDASTATQRTSTCTPTNKSYALNVERSSPLATSRQLAPLKLSNSSPSNQLNRQISASNLANLSPTNKEASLMKRENLSPTNKRETTKALEDVEPAHDSLPKPFSLVLKKLVSNRNNPTSPLERGNSLAQFIGTIVKLQQNTSRSARSRGGSGQSARSGTPTSVSSLAKVNESVEEEEVLVETSSVESLKSAEKNQRVNKYVDDSSTHDEENEMSRSKLVYQKSVKNLHGIANMLSKIVKVQEATKKRMSKHPLLATHQSFMQAMQSSRALQELTAQLQVDNLEDMIDDDELQSAADIDPADMFCDGSDNEFDSQLEALIKNSREQDLKDNVDSTQQEGSQGSSKLVHNTGKVCVSRWKVLRGLQGFKVTRPDQPGSMSEDRPTLHVLPKKNGWKLARWMKPMIGLQARDIVQTNKKKRAMKAREDNLSRQLAQRDTQLRAKKASIDPQSSITLMQPEQAATMVQNCWRSYYAYKLAVGLRVRQRPDSVVVRRAGEYSVNGTYERVGRQNDAPFFVKEPCGADDSVMSLIERMNIGSRHCWVIAQVSLSSGNHNIAYLNDKSTQFTCELPASTGWQPGNKGIQPNPICELKVDMSNRLVYRVRNCGLLALNETTLEQAGTVDGVSNYQGLCRFDHASSSDAPTTTLVLRRIEHGEYGDFMWILAGVSLDTGTTQVYYVNIEMGALKTPPLFGWICGQDGEYPVPEFVQEPFSVDNIREQLKRGY